MIDVPSTRNQKRLIHGSRDRRSLVPVAWVASLVGFIALFGTTVRDGLMLVTHYAWLVKPSGLYCSLPTQDGGLPPGRRVGLELQARPGAEERMDRDLGLDSRQRRPRP